MCTSTTAPRAITTACISLTSISRSVRQFSGLPFIYSQLSHQHFCPAIKINVTLLLKIQRCLFRVKRQELNAEGRRNIPEEVSKIRANVRNLRFNFFVYVTVHFVVCFA